MESIDLLKTPISTALTKYIKKIERNKKSKKARETTYYSDFISFLENIFPPKKGYLVQSERKLDHSKARPDITVSHNGIILFHVEAKAPEENVVDLLNVKESRLNDQIYRYRQEGSQLLITDFYNVYLVDDKIENSPQSKQKYRFKCKLIKPSHSHLIPAKNAEDNFKDLLTQTCENYIQTINDVKKLISPLSVSAKAIKKKTSYLLRHKDSESLNNTEKMASQYLYDILKDFRRSIFKEEKEDEIKLFSDLFAQTLVYGAFSAWINYCQKKNDPKEFNLDKVGDFLPYGSFLRDLFLNLKNTVPVEFKPILRNMEKRFQKVDYRILNNTESLITTFYSDFLQEYDPKTAKNRGVVYTPDVIVKFIIDGIDFMLKRWLKKPNGIISDYFSLKKTKEINKEKESGKEKQKSLKQISLDEIKDVKTIDRLRILDPAAGTMAFAAGFLHMAKRKFIEKYPSRSSLGISNFQSWVKEEFFPNMYAFEILMAPYVLGQIRTFLTLESLGIQLNPSEYKLNSFLMNTLMTPPEQKNLDDWMFLNQNIGNEIKEALNIRDKKDIFVIMGNPPYNLSSQNDCEWINRKIDDYKKGLKARNTKILNDDYVKFIRFAQWKIKKVGRGILAFITNSKFIDGQIYNIMRKSLRETFDHIYIVNLRGDMRKKEKGNVFGIKVGVCISFMVRVDNSPNKKAAIHYMDVPQDTKEDKFKVLRAGFSEGGFKLLDETPHNYFVDMNTTYLDRYQSFIPINEFFKRKPKSGIMIGRDHLLADVDKENLIWNVETFFKREFEELENLKIKVHDTKSWNKKKVFSKTNLKNVINSITTLQYRGFDYRHFAYERGIVEGHRMGYIDFIRPGNPAITVTKSSRKKKFCTAFISEHPIEKCFMSVTDTAYAFLLKYKGKPNVIIPAVDYQITPESLFYYIYGVLYSTTYRKRYDEFLRKQYPRIPLTENGTLFKKMSGFGEELANAHLLHLEISPTFTLSDTKPDQWIIRDFFYSKEDKKIYFAQKDDKNEEKKQNNENTPWIGNVSPSIWNYELGGNPQIEQFMSSRAYSSNRKWDSLQRSLTHRELKHLLKLCSAIEITLEIQPKIDKIYKKIDRIG